MRLWERVFRRARIQIAYSEGFNPHPRISLAVPLAVGITSEAELMDVFLTRPVSPHWFDAAVSQQLPSGIGILGIYQTALNLPSLQSQVRYAEYRVGLDASEGPGDLTSAVTALLSVEKLPWHHQRDTGRRSYDLRALIDDLRIINGSGSIVEMRLRCDSSGAGRPEQVSLALGFPHHPLSIHRTKLILDVSK